LINLELLFGKIFKKRQRNPDSKRDQIVMHEGFEETHWYRFHQAAKVQFATVLELTKEL
jgi:hypothetical protein